MPGLDYYGAYDPYERDNPLTSLKGAAAYVGAEIAASGYGIRGHAHRQMTKARGIATEARTTRAAGMKAMPPPSKRHRLAMSELNAKVGPLEARATSLRQRANVNKKFAGSLKTLGRTFGIATAVTLGYELGKSMFDVGSDFRIRKQDLAQQRRKIYNEDTFMDSRAAFTQRQRAIQVIHNSQLGVRSAMGSEASYLHY